MKNLSRMKYDAKMTVKMTPKSKPQFEEIVGLFDPLF